jgi:hypothetical protein
MKNYKVTNVLLIILIIAVLAVGYLIIKNSKTTLEDKSNTLAKNETIIQPNWKNVSENDFVNLVSKEADAFFEKEFGLELSDEIDLTGDGINEAVVSGNGGNNGVSFVLKKEGGNTIVLKQKEKDGSISPVALYEVGRVMVNVNFKLLPSEHGFYTASMIFDESANNTETSHFICDEESINAYAWNETTQMFEWNQTLTTKYTKEVCK